MRKKSFSPKNIFLFVLLIVVVVILSLFVFSRSFLKAHNPAAIVASFIVDLTNNYRAENKVAKLTVNPLLQKAAQLKADDMASKGYFSHTTPEGKSLTYFLGQAGYNYKYAGENLAVNFFDSTDVTNAWINSASHRDNLVKDKYTEIGVASASGFYQGRPSVFVVQYFGAPI